MLCSYYALQKYYFQKWQAIRYTRLIHHIHPGSHSTLFVSHAVWFLKACQKAVRRLLGINLSASLIQI